MRRLPAICTLFGLLLFAGCDHAPPIDEVRVMAGEVTGGEAIVAGEQDWPWWLGPNFDGTISGGNVPSQWSESENVVWRAEVPGRGHSSPIVAGDRVFLTTADEQAKKQDILCFDRQSGELKWQTTAHQGGLMRSHKKNSRASATPAFDGKRLFAAFINADALQVTATDTAGKILWQQEAGPFKSEHGYGSSPVLYKSLLIVNGDNAGSSFIAALDRATGKVVWRTARQRPGRHGNYATPLVRNVAGREQLLLPGHGILTSYDPATGELLWSCDGPAEVAACTVACSDRLVFASAGYPEKEILAVRADGSGDVTGSHIEWRSAKGVTYVPTPIFHKGRLFMVNDQGIASCFDGESGDVVWRERLGGSFSASPILAGDRLLVTNEAGVTYVLAAGPTFKQHAKNDLGSGGFASPAISGDQIFLRTGSHLYCFGAK